MIVGKYLERQAQQRPDKVAVICNDVQLTYAEINRKANRLANWLLGQGVKKGDRAVMLMPNCAEFAVVYFALMKIGVIAVILDFRRRWHPSSMRPGRGSLSPIPNRRPLPCGCCARRKAYATLSFLETKT